MKITSNTLVRNGMPFIDLVLRQVEPFVDEMIITQSLKSTDRTSKVIERFEKQFPVKTKVYFEDVEEPGMLTNVREQQLKVSNSDWILFLDDDDYWPTSSLEQIVELIKKDEDVDGYSFTPLQVVDDKYHDKSWAHKGFTKLFRNRSGVHYERNWPRDLIFKYEQPLYWKANPRVKSVKIPFFHLSYIKGGSFREEDWACSFKHALGSKRTYQKKYKVEINKLYEYIRRNK